MAYSCFKYTLVRRSPEAKSGVSQGIADDYLRALP